MKAERRWPAGEERRVASQCLAQQGSGGCQRSTLWKSEIAGVTERRNGSLGLRDDDDDDEGC